LIDESDRPSPDVVSDVSPVADAQADEIIELQAETSSGEPAFLDYVSRIVRGEHDALGFLYDETNRLVYGFAFRILRDPADAEEVTLDVYTQIWRNASSFDQGRGSVLAWLMMLTRSRAIDRLRSSSARNRHEQPIDSYEKSAGLSHPAFGLERAVRIALNSLPPEQREAIELAYFSGYSHSELAERLGQPLGTIKTRIRLGMMRMRSLLVPQSRTATHAT
jgi:RNA polymerase sigma-70 factor (ECF subfamily)